MNGFIKKTVAGSCLSVGLVLIASGCVHYRDLVDPCWPERYNSMSRHSIREMSTAQAERGHMLEQTIWNWHFEADPKTGGPTDKLNQAGIAKLGLITRTMPSPDFQLFLQTAQDIVYKEGIAPEKLVTQRQQLDERRMQAIQRFLATQTPLHGGGTYQIAVHDIAPPGLPGVWPPMADENILKTVKTGVPYPLQAPPSSTGGSK